MSKDTFHFDFDKKLAYKNNELIGEIESHDDTVINVRLPDGNEQEFRLYVPKEKNTNFET